MGVNHNDIAILVKQVKQGNLASQRGLYEHCFTHCFKIAQIYCGHKEEAMGVFNHSMLDVFNQLGNLQNPKSLIPWVNSVIKRDCIDHVRKQGAYRNRLVVFDSTDLNVEIENEGLSQLEMNDIINLVNELKATYRLCFVMKAIEGYTYEEISEKLSINVNTIKWYYGEARKILRKKVEGLYHFSKNGDQ